MDARMQRAQQRAILLWDERDYRGYWRQVNLIYTVFPGFDLSLPHNPVVDWGRQKLLEDSMATTTLLDP